MNWVDVIIIVILLIGLGKGLANGFVRGLFGLVALVLGIMLAAANYQQVAEFMPDFLPFGEQGVAIISFLLIFVIVLDWGVQGVAFAYWTICEADAELVRQVTAIPVVGFSVRFSMIRSGESWA